ncbi:MAG: hypothetical protein MR709_05630 [Bacteroidales bacterium]|nr:hypothetical protein [Bacteroidales bacterium]MCI7653808.1 hypothetical protein [Bacteroidales bacterium]MDD7705972.1 hypothetical protein [Bacteroidales bacterium]MDY4706280.1 hypothetical protein [Prevotella sp.]MDY5320662.1 hypothetical protein [Prevotella sp.]
MMMIFVTKIVILFEKQGKAPENFPFCRFSYGLSYRQKESPAAITGKGGEAGLGFLRLLMVV